MPFSLCPDTSSSGPHLIKPTSFAFTPSSPAPWVAMLLRQWTPPSVGGPSSKVALSTIFPNDVRPPLCASTAGPDPNQRPHLGRRVYAWTFGGEMLLSPQEAPPS